MAKPTLYLTKDGSNTLFNAELDEHYHSVHGAITESNHVFIDAGLKFIGAEKNSVSILEMGFGTGLNALLTFLQSDELNLDVKYHTLEAYPLTWGQVVDLNYLQLLEVPKQEELFKTLHECDWDTEYKLGPNFYFTKQKAFLENLTEEENTPSYDIIYYDAFAPSAQPELWTPEIFKFLYNRLNNSGVLTTYCAKGQVKRDLKSVGFEVESLPGPPGKREMTRAIKR